MCQLTAHILFGFIMPHERDFVVLRNQESHNHMQHLHGKFNEHLPKNTAIPVTGRGGL
jgi:hypothetical protein